MNNNLIANPAWRLAHSFSTAKLNFNYVAFAVAQAFAIGRLMVFLCSLTCAYIHSAFAAATSIFSAAGGRTAQHHRQHQYRGYQ